MSMKDSSKTPEISLEDLFLDQVDFTQPYERPKAKVKPTTKPKPAPRAAFTSPWKAIARIFYTTRVTHQCCQSSYLTSDCQGPLVRFQHKRHPETLWEIADHPEQFNSDLDKIIQESSEVRAICPQCFLKNEREFNPLMAGKYAQEHKAKFKPGISKEQTEEILVLLWNLPTTLLLTHQTEVN